MAYKIYGIDIPKLNPRTSYVNVLSADGVFAIIYSVNQPENVEILDTIDDSRINDIITLPEWRQPCINCT